MAYAETAAIIGGALAAAGSAGSAVATGKMNKKNREFSEKMWHAQNDYNNPINQRARLEAAGLNPHLIYGSNSSGGVSAPTPDFKHQAADYNINGTAIANSYMDARMRREQINNLQAQNEVIQQDALLKAAQIAQTQKSTAKTEFETMKGQSLLDYSLEAAKENIRKTQVSTQVMLNQDERAAALNSSTIKEALQRISLMRQQEATSVEERNRIRADIDRIKNSSETIKLENDLRKKGINPNDSTWMSIISRLLNGGGEPLIDKDKIMNSPLVPINR